MPRTASGLAVGLADSLQKYFTHTLPPRARELDLSGLRGEVLSFQVVYRAAGQGVVELDLSGAPAAWSEARGIGLAHVEHPTYSVAPEELCGAAPGFFPDPLLPAESHDAFPGQTRGVWVTVRIPDNARAGRRVLNVGVIWGGVVAARLRVQVEVVPARLPGQRLKVIHWFHNDCLMSHYGFEAWSRPHWRMLEPYLRNAADHGVNTITTPVFTPPLDTAVGTERPTVQLVDVTVTGKDRYRFGFGRLEKWIDLCRRCGMTDFEISHLSTQWGAKSAPKVMAKVGGRAERIFGWGDASDGPRYERFLLQFLPRLVSCLRRKGAVSRSYLHVSDEPRAAQLPQYSAVREILRRGAPELPVVEALSEFEFYEHGLVDRPCPATNHAQPFLDRGVPHLWCYYCTGQRQGVSNRFMDFPSARNRILGWQLYKFGFEGFLHWGYNHWYGGLADELIDPYTNSHAGRPLPPGDGFMVYPGRDGPVDAMRWEVFREGLQDMRALQMLAGLTADKPSREASRLLDLRPVESMFAYPRSAGWILETRGAVNREIGRLVKE